ncbi:hypothetical protein Y032_0111g255 [Ancylostoma ceylanicum]|uniref:Uncharacterized protein n=1 Tax=Ancylostoma ceylanicum TaxID=53326 RepID=A0A016TEM4_9BILA|nr:hypothetical protein Y032_0111g255 [Ancylostoma ceylanicum]
MKKTWNNLLDNYWRIVKAFDTESERAERWKFYEAMRFMEEANGDEPSSLRGHGFDPHNVPSSSGSAPHFCNVPLQLKGMSGYGRKRVSRRDFVQISIPELDRLIETKQRPALGILIQCMPADPTEDHLTSEMELVWGQLEEEANAKLEAEQDMRTSEMELVWKQLEEEQITELKAERATRAALTNEREAAERICRTLPETRKSKGKLRLTTDFDNKFVDLIKIARFNYKVTDVTRIMIINRAAHLRGIYQKGAFALFVKQGMPQGQLQKLLNAFDDFVYNNKPRDPVTSEVVKECDPSVHTAFVALFSIIDRYHLNTFAVK